jgi:hypothetical protein
MNTLRLRSCFAFSVAVSFIAAATPALGLANRVFVSARSGHDANSCDNVKTPCQTFAEAVTQLSPDGEVIVLDSGDYGPVTITQGVTIEAPTGVTAFIHPPSGDAITVNASRTEKVTLRGLTLNVGANNGVTVNSVGTLNVENCFITGFSQKGILMLSAGVLNVKATVVTACPRGVVIANAIGVARVTVDHCHLDGNIGTGFIAGTTFSGSSTTTAIYSTANNNGVVGWLCGDATSGKDLIILEFCTGSENVNAGLAEAGLNVQSVARYSNCVFANNEAFGVTRGGSGSVETRGNNTITGNGMAPTAGSIGTFSPM